ncbi:MAG: NADH-quinone oxidoreductase subunit NuoE [Christensenellales bacterium]|jgi:NADH:ubiquinone oxidoreductase subunit E
MAENALEKERFDQLKAVIERYRDIEGPLMPVMQKAQDIFGYLPIEVQNFIAEGLDVPLSDVYGVATFYSQFALAAKGKYQIGVCMGTACYVKGSQQVLDELAKALSVDVGHTTEDGKFTLEATRCLGCCGLAPVIMINEEVYGRLTPSMIPDVLSKY